MKHFTLIFFLITAFFAKANAQLQQVAQGSGYADQVFVDIANNTQQTIAHNDWDIAFGVAPFSSAVILNEGGSISGGTLQLFASDATDFATADTTQITQQIYNNEISWTAGAFNHVATPGDPFDQGWGNYNPATHGVDGSRIFFLVDREGIYHKLMIESLSNNTYTLRHALLNGSEEESISINKNEFAGKSLAYYSFAQGVLDLEPENWQLFFTRYTTPLDAGDGQIVEYNVTGVLQNNGIRVAELSGVDPVNVEVPTDDALYSDTLTTIGYDWKSFDLGTFTWSISEDRVYFVRDAEDHIYRVRFVGFEGSSTGVSSLAVVDEGILSSVTTLPTYVDAVSLYPNPARDRAYLNIETTTNSNVQAFSIVNLMGQTVRQINTASQLTTGKNQLSIELDGLASGQYLLRLQLDNDLIVKPLIVR